MQITKKIKLSAIFMAVMMVFCLFPSGIFAGNDTTNIVIVHTNDTHGRYTYTKDSVVGFEKLATIANTNQADLILDAGDTWHGQSFATVEKGESTAELLKAVGYTAMTPGNHDFNYGKDQMKNLEALSGVPILSCNIIDNATGDPYFTPSMTTTVQDDIQVGIIGVTSPDIYNDTAPANVEGLTFADPTPYVQNEVDKLKGDGCTVIIFLAHMGDSSVLDWTSDRIVSETTGIDLVIDGHTHDVENKRVSWKDNQGQALCVQTGAFFENAGLLTITYDNEANKVVNLSTDNEQLISATNAASIESDQAVAAKIREIQERESSILDEVIGTSPKEAAYTWEDVRCGQMAIGTIITDAYLSETGADVAFENAGGIRGGIPQGDITQGDIINIAPFGNYVVTKAISGEDLLAIIENNFIIEDANNAAYSAGPDASWPDNNGSYLQIGGIDVVYNPNAEAGSRIVSASIRGEAIDPEQQYTVATNNFVAESSDYPALAAAEEIHQYNACDEILTAYIGTDGWTDSFEHHYFALQPDTDGPTKPRPTLVEPQNTAAQPSATAESAAGSTNVNTGLESDQETAAVVIMLIAAAAVSAVIVRKRFNS